MISKRFPKDPTGKNTGKSRKNWCDFVPMVDLPRKSAPRKKKLPAVHYWSLSHPLGVKVIARGHLAIKQLVILITDLDRVRSKVEKSKLVESPHSQFDLAAQYVLAKNAELYQRLAK